MLDWVYTNSPTVAPLAAEPSALRKRWFAWLQKWVTFKALGKGDGKVYVLLEGDDEVVATTVVLPPSRKKLWKTGTLELCYLVLKCGAPPETDGPAGVMDRLEAVGDKTDEMHDTHAAMPHLFVNVFAVDPEKQGKGYGSVLLKFVASLADEAGVPAYLETRGERNVAFYSKKGGFAEVERAPIVAKNGDSYCFEAMLRDAPTHPRTADEEE
mmetsp:Transcript_24481/g.79080  ORF Transcript_24481/g.79080 Transcript_24481/m.79080 type:complete len:212 (+) Transcript_24481:270-905(+)